MRKPEIMTLTGLRIFAAAAVVISHSFDISLALFPQLSPLASYAPIGDAGVGVFFVLSGFILYYNYGHTFGTTVDRGTYLQFVRRRFARLYPNHIFTLVTIGFLAWGLGGPFAEVFHAPASSLPFQLTMTHSFYWDRGSELAWNQPAWSISAEWVMYLVFPLLTLWLARRKSVLGLLALPIALFVCEVVLNFPAVPFGSGLVSIIGMFPVGVAVGILCGTRSVRFPNPDVLVCGVAIAAFVALGHVHNFWRLPIIMVIALLIVPITQCRGIVQRVLTSRPCVFLGHASYAIYMVHDIVLRSARSPIEDIAVGRPAGLRALAIVALYGLVIGIGVLTYKVIERPFEALLRGGTPRRIQTSAPLKTI